MAPRTAESDEDAFRRPTHSRAAAPFQGNLLSSSTEQRLQGVV